MPLISVDRLTGLSVAILVAAGAPRDHAECVAAAVVGSNRAGHDSHGVMKLPSYVRDIRRGKLRPAAKPQVVAESAATAVIDAAAAFGHVAAELATDLAVTKARDAGLAAVAVSHCHHTGRLGGWSERVAASGMIGMIAGGEAQPPYMVAPHGGRHGALATNPISWALPRSGKPPILLDYATSAVSIGKLQAARALGVGIPEGWVTDADGRPSADLNDFFSGGFLLPFGAHKGYALAVVVELLAVGLGRGERVAPPDRSSCLFVLAIDPARFRPIEEFEDFVDATVTRLKAVAPSSPGGEVLVPGEPEARARVARSDGIPVPEPTWRALCAVADELSVRRIDFTA